jgi:rhodanese-related sulfurtransferase
MLGQEPVATPGRDELKTKLDKGEPIKLVMALNRWAYDAKHIPGSLHFDDPDDLYSSLQKDDEIIVYCSNVDCLSSVALYRALIRARLPQCSALRGWAARLGGGGAHP